MCAARFTSASQFVQSASRLQYSNGMLLDGVGVECVHGASCPHGSHLPLVGVFVDTLVVPLPRDSLLACCQHEGDANARCEVAA